MGFKEKFALVAEVFKNELKGKHRRGMERVDEHQRKATEQVMKHVERDQKMTDRVIELKEVENQYSNLLEHTKEQIIELKKGELRAEGEKLVEIKEKIIDLDDLKEKISEELSDIRAEILQIEDIQRKLNAGLKVELDKAVRRANRTFDQWTGNKDYILLRDGTFKKRRR